MKCKSLCSERVSQETELKNPVIIHAFSTRLGMAGQTRSCLSIVMTLALVLGSAVVRADAVLDWNEIAVNTAIADGQNGFAQARYGAIVQLAVFEAVNSITGDYRPYLGMIVAPHGASPDAAAIQAAYRVLSTYSPGILNCGGEEPSLARSSIMARAAASPVAMPSVLAWPSGIAARDLARAASSVAALPGE